MPTLNWIGKEKVVNHHLEVPFYTLEHQFSLSGRTDKAVRYKYFMTYWHHGAEGIVAVNKLVELMKRM